jgi:hypothetical protein
MAEYFKTTSSKAIEPDKATTISRKDSKLTLMVTLSGSQGTTYYEHTLLICKTVKSLRAHVICNLLQNVEKIFTARLTLSTPTPKSADPSAILLNPYVQVVCFYISRPLDCVGHSLAKPVPPLIPGPHAAFSFAFFRLVGFACYDLNSEL